MSAIEEYYYLQQILNIKNKKYRKTFQLKYTCTLVISRLRLTMNNFAVKETVKTIERVITSCHSLSLYRFNFDS